MAVKKEPHIDSNTIVEMKISELHPFQNHPFKVLDDELMQQTIDSIAQVGVLSPAVVRPDPGGGYEIISGHRRLHACKAIGLETMPVIVKNLTDDEAVIFMVDSNLQRENILPSERALAYKMKMDALKHQGQREKSTSDQVGPKSWTAAKLGAEVGDSATQVKRYIRLAELIPELLSKVDKKEISLTPAVELAYLTQEEQQGFLDAMAKESQDMENGDAYIVYSCVVDPCLKSKELQEAFSCADPMEIVDMVFEPGEIPLIAVECLKLAGYIDGVKAVDELKN